MAVVYRITSPSGKAYIGVAKRSARERFTKHKNDARNGRGTALCAAIRKYGEDAFLVETLIESTSEYCFDLEVKAIKAFGTLHPYGYNLTSGGEGVHDMAEHSRLKHKAALNTPEQLAKRSESAKRYSSRPEVIEMKKSLMKKRWETEEWRKHMKNVARAKKAEKAKALTVEKTCAFCFEKFKCMSKVSSYKLYCDRKCSSAASHEARKERNERF